MPSQMSGNLFPSHKLKGNHTFTTQTAITGNDEAEEDSSVKQEGDMEPSADKDVEASSRVGEMDQTIEYIICFIKVVELYQKKNKNCLGMGVLITSYETVQRRLANLPSKHL